MGWLICGYLALWVRSFFQFEALPSPRWMLLKNQEHFCPVAILVAQPEADNQVCLLARVSDTAVAVSCRQKPIDSRKNYRMLLKVILVLTALHWNAGWILSFRTQQHQLLSLPQKAPGCVGTGSDVKWMELEEVWRIFTLLHTRLS